MNSSKTIVRLETSVPERLIIKYHFPVSLIRYCSSNPSGGVRLNISKEENIRVKLTDSSSLKYNSILILRKYTIPKIYVPVISPH
jgi:hypothetical protein